MAISRDDIFAYTHPEPLSEDYDVPRLGVIHIEGIADKQQRDDIQKEIAGLLMILSKNALKPKHPTTGKTYTPTEDNIRQAVWAAHCVTEPGLSAIEWLNFAAEGFDLLQIIQFRCYVCSRLLEDTAEDENGDEVKLPDGVDAAKAGLQKDPSNSGGGSSVSGS